MRRRLVWVMAVSAIVLAAMPGVLQPRTVSATTAHPSLLFSSSDVPGLRAKITSGIPAEAWAQLQRKVDSCTDPTSPNYIFTQQQIFYPDGSVFPGWRIYDGFFGQNQVSTYLTDLSMAYVLSGNTKYSDMAIQLMLVEANSNFPAWADSSGTAYELGRGDLSKGMALAWDWTYDQWTDAEKATYIAAINRDVTVLMDCLYPSFAPLGQQGNNWYGVCGGGTGLLLLALQGEPGLTVDTTTLLSNARGRVLPYMQGVFGSNGDGSEGITYAGYGLHNSLPFAFAWKRIQGEDLVAQAPGVSNVPRWLALEQIPGQGSRFLNRNDSNETVTFSEVMPMFFNVRADGLVAWDWDHFYGPDGDDIYGAGAEPVYLAPAPVGDDLCTSLTTDPTRIFNCWNANEAFTILYWQSITPADPSTFGLPSQYYSEHGLVDYRSGWAGGANEVVGSFETRHNGVPGIHSQVDMGQFTLLGYGGQWAVDSGYKGGENNAGASGHNLVTVGCNTNARNGSYDNVQPIAAYGAAPGEVFVRADMRYAYSATPSSVPWAQRSLYFGSGPGEPPVLVVADSINASWTHVNYCWNMHTDARNQLSIVGNNFTAIAPNQAAMVGSVASNGGTPALAPVPYAAGSDPAVHNVLTDVNSLSVTLDHLAVMALEPAFQLNGVSVVASGLAGGNTANVTWSGGHIIVAATDHGTASLDTGSLQLTGEFGKVTVGKGESVLDDGSSLSAGGITYVSVTGGTATVVVSGDTVTASGAAGETYTVYAPQSVTTVQVNGTAVNSCRSGNSLSFPC